MFAVFAMRESSTKQRQQLTALKMRLRSSAAAAATATIDNATAVDDGVGSESRVKRRMQ